MGANSSEQRPGEGARFLIDFPAATVDVSALLSELPPTASRGELVLSWKMNPTVAQLIAEMLSDLGYKCEIHHGARHALISALNRDYSQVICDIKISALAVRMRETVRRLSQACKARADQIHSS